jgi:hypothetical protein
MNTAIFDRYAPAIIGDRPEMFNALEVQGVRDLALPDDEGTCIEVDNQNPQFFAVYARYIEGGCDCVGDFSDPADALAYGDELAQKYGWPVYNFTKH